MFLPMAKLTSFFFRRFCEQIYIISLSLVFLYNIIMTSLTTLFFCISGCLGDCLRKLRFFVQPPNDLTDDPILFCISGCLGDCLRKLCLFVDPLMTLLTISFFCLSDCLEIACGSYAFFCNRPHDFTDDRFLFCHQCALTHPLLSNSNAHSHAHPLIDTRTNTLSHSPRPSAVLLLVRAGPPAVLL